MIYFDTEHEAYQQKETIEKWGKTYLTECTNEEYAELQEGKLIWQDDEIVENPNYDDEQTAKRQAEFEKEFFETSLGWIRRAVNMANGTTKDFLSDLLPTISMAVQSGTPVNIIAYNEPDFTEEITDWKPYQHLEVVTPQFIQECFLQLSNDFLPINEEENG